MSSMPEKTTQKGQDSSLSSTLSRVSETIDRLYHRNATSALQKILTKVMPADLAMVLETMPAEMAVKLFELIPQSLAASQVLKELSVPMQKAILSESVPEKMIPILEKMAPDARTDVIAQLEPELANRLLSSLNLQVQKDVETLMQYSSDTAGGLMTSQFFALPENTTVTQAIESVRALAAYEMVFYLYIVDDLGRLTGVSSLRQLILSHPDHIMTEMMNRRVIKVNVDTPQEEVARIASHYRLLAMPVVDEEGVLVGLITVDDVIQVIREEVTDEVLKLAGTSSNEIDATTSMEIFKIRLPWMFMVFLGGFAACGVVTLFMVDVTNRLLMLASLLPLIVGLSGHFGAVASTVASRTLSTGGSLVLPLFYKELWASLMLGTLYGTLSGGLSWLIFGNLVLSCALAFAVTVNMVVAAIMAVTMQAMLQHHGVQPSSSTGPLVASVIDIIAVAIYFLAARVLQQYIGG